MGTKSLQHEALAAYERSLKQDVSTRTELTMEAFEKAFPGFEYDSIEDNVISFRSYDIAYYPHTGFCYFPDGVQPHNIGFSLDPDSSGIFTQGLRFASLKELGRLMSANPPSKR